MPPRGRPASRGTRRGGRTSDPIKTEPDVGEPSLAQTPAATQATAASPARPSTTPTSQQRGGLTSMRGASIRRPTRGPTVSRFKPKNVRRSEAERDALARQEDQKAMERAAEDRRDSRGRGRYRSKRSRGDTMGSRGGSSRSTATASGPFSSGVGASGRSFARVGASGPFGGGSGGGGGGGSRSFGSGAAKSEHKGSMGFAQSDEDHMREARINADRLHANGPDDDLDDEDYAMMEALLARSGSIMPMGIYRREHKEAEVVVATTAELEAAEQAAAGEEESLWVDGKAPDVDVDMPQPEEEGVWGKAASSRAPRIKKEPDTDAEDTMDIDTAEEAPKAKAKGKEVQRERSAEKPKPNKVVLHDPEEDMISSDLHLLANELGTTTIKETADEEASGKETMQTPLNKDGRMYLFQFPPLLPPLHQTRQPSKSTKGKVKDEPHDLDMHDALAESNSANPVDLTAEEAGGKAGQTAAAAAAAAAADPEDTRGFMSELLSQGGMIGKLNIRKSGKTELDWGGRILELSPAAGMNFLTTAVIVEESDVKPERGAVGGDGIGMGKIMGRFVLAPTWDEEEEWNVAPEELEMN